MYFRTLKTIFLCLALTSLWQGSLSAEKGIVSNQSTNSFTALPQRVVVGYWHNWENQNAPFIKLRDVRDTKYNVVNVSFIETWKEGESGGPAEFKGEGVHPKFVVYDGSKTTNLTYSEAEFKNDVQLVQEAGIPVLISIGGQNGHVEIRNEEEKDIYVQGIIDIVTEYGFDGIDIDYEGGSMVVLNGPADSLEYEDITDPELKYGIDAIREIKTHFGDDFIITTAPELAYVQEGRLSYPASGQFLPFLHNIRDILDYIHVQYYNFGSAVWSALDGKSYSVGDIDFVVAMTDMLITGFPVKTTGSLTFPGLRPDQVALGLPCVPNAAGGVTAQNPNGYYLPPSEVLKAFNYLMKGEKTADMTYSLLQNKGPYPALRGIMTWSINWDATTDGSTEAYEFANNYSQYLQDFGKPADPLSPGKSWIRNDAFATHKVTSDWGTGYSGHFEVQPSGLGTDVSIKALRIYFRSPVRLPLRSYLYHVEDDLYYVERDLENRGESLLYPTDSSAFGSSVYDYTGSGDHSKITIEAFYYCTRVTDSNGLRPVLEAMPPDTAKIYFPQHEASEKIIHRLSIPSGTSSLSYALNGPVDKALSINVSNPKVLSATINTSTKTISLNGLHAGRSSIKLTHPDGEVRLLGIAVKQSDGTAPPEIPGYLGVGGVHENHNNEMDYLDEWDNSNPLKQKWYDFHYSYVQGGTFSTISSWRTDATYDGERVSKLTRNALKRGAIPVYTWYNMVSGTHGDGDVYKALQDTTHMKEYFYDFKVFLDMAKDELAGENCVIVLEPDQIGYLAQQQAESPGEISVPVYKAYEVGLLDRATDPAFSNNVIGWVRAINYAISKHLPQARFGWKVNLWATRLGSTFPIPEKGICRSTDGLNTEAEVLAQRKKIYAEARAIARYYKACDVDSYNADFLALDKYGWDGGRELNQVGVDHPEQTKWLWNAAHWVNYLAFTRGLHDESGLPICLWQLPMGHLDSTQTNNPWKPDGSFTDLGNRGATYYEDSTVSFFFGDTFRETDSQDKTYFLKEYGIADVSEDSNGNIVWSDHLDLVKQAGVEMMLFGHGLADSTWGWYTTSNRQDAPPDDNFFNTKVQDYLNKLADDETRIPAGNELAAITADYTPPTDPDPDPDPDPEPDPDPDPEPEPEPDAVALIPNPNYSETFDISNAWSTKGEWYNVVEITIKNNSSSSIDLRNGVFLYESLTPATDHGFKNINSISYPNALAFQNYPTADSAVRQYRSLLTFVDESYVDSTIAANESFTITIAFGQLSQEQYDKVTGSARFFSYNNLSPEFFAALRLKTPAKPEEAFTTTKAFLKNTDLGQTETKTVTFGEEFVFSLLPNNNYELSFPEFSSPTHRYTPNYTEANPYELLANNTGAVPETTLSFTATAIAPASVTVDLRWMPVGMQADLDLYFDGSGSDYHASRVTAAGKTLSVAPGSYRLAVTNLKETDDRDYYVSMLENKFTFESDKTYTIGGITFPVQPPRVVPRWPNYLSMGTVGNGAIETDSALTAAPVDCFFVYAGEGGNGDRGEILDTPLRATTNTIAQARRIEAIQGKNILPVMVIYTAEYSGGNNENKDFTDDNLYMHYVNLIRQVITLQSNHDATHPHAGSIVLNPDCLGVLQQGNLTNLPPASGGTQGLTIKVKEQLARAIQYIVDNDKIDPVTVPDSLTDDLKGWIQSQNFIIRHFGPNITYGWQQNVWSTRDSLWVHTHSDSEIDQQISTPLVNFMTELEVYEGPWKPDFLVFDRYERDSFSKISRFNGYAYSNLSWDRYFTHIEQVSKKMGDMPIMLWQIPGGHMPVIGEDTGAYDLIDHACSAAPYILGDDRIGTDLTKINPTVLNLTLPDPAKYGSASLATVKALLETGAGYDWGTNHLQRLIDMNVFALLWGGGTTTSVGSLGTNGDDNGWLAEKVKQYYQAPNQLIKSKAPTLITHNNKSVSIDFVAIKDPWNDPRKEPTRPYGYVDHPYQIGKYEVSAAQFARVLAADSRVGDGDESHWVSQQIGTAIQSPAANVSWLEAAKFCNWLTSGSAYNGVYLFDNTGKYSRTDRKAALSTYTNIYALPTDDEWYKAACYTGNGYSDYTFGSSILPLDGVDANWGQRGSPWHIGAGIRDQNDTHDLFGNLEEWLENSDAFETLNNWEAETRLIAPSSYEGFDEDSFIPATSKDLATEDVSLGFRVVSIERQNFKTSKGTPHEWLESHALVENQNHELADGMDPDQDGLANSDEYLLGTNPTSGSSIYKLDLNREGTLKWDTRPGRRYEIQWTDSLTQSFQTLKVLPYTTNQLQNPIGAIKHINPSIGTFEIDPEVGIEDPDTAGPKQLFYRLKVTKE